MPKLVFENLNSVYTIARARVPGGWLVYISAVGNGMTFYPDPNHIWDGGSLP